MPLAVTETTFRDAHQSLLATRVRTRDLVARRTARRADDARSCSRSRRGAARPTTSRCASSPKTRGSASPRCARRCRTSRSRCCCAAATPSATRRGPTRSTDAFVREAARHRRRHLPHLRRAQRRQPDAPGDRCGARDRHRRRRGRGLLHRRPARPGRDALHARLLPAARRADRRVGRAHPRDQGHGGAAAAGRRSEARHGAARALRPAGPPAHARHRGRPARDAARRERRGGGRRGCRGRAAVGHDEPALPVGAGRRARAHRARHRHRPRTP